LSKYRQNVWICPSNLRYFKEENGVLWSRYLTIITPYLTLNYKTDVLVRELIKHWHIFPISWIITVIIVYGILGLR